jgi:hypothetical protein
MTEESMIIEMNIAHYEAILKLDLDDRKRAVVERLRAEAQENLMLADKHADQSNAKRDPIYRKFPKEQSAEGIGRRLLDVIVHLKNSHSGDSFTISNLVETTEVGDWTMPDVRIAQTYAASHGWLVVEGDTLTLTTAGWSAAA